jgi:hypothetical protein
MTRSLPFLGAQFPRGKRELQEKVWRGIDILILYKAFGEKNCSDHDASECDILGVHDRLILGSAETVCWFERFES